MSGEYVIPVKVALRCRPLVPKEEFEKCQTCVEFVAGEPQIIISGNKSFTYDYVFKPEATQEEVYSNAVSPLVKGIFEGYNATVLAYGQTGSGKTHTMGGGFDACTSTSDAVMGVIPRTILSLSEGIEKYKENFEVNVKVSYLELYNDDLLDLLVLPTKRDKEKLQIHEDQNGDIKLAGLSEVEVHTLQAMLKLLERGSHGRTTGATAIFTIHIDRTTDANDFCKAKFYLVDLAGSERAKKTNAEGDRFKEGVNINLGLLSLGNVISALEKDSSRRGHIPYRDSKLTRLLQDSLGGNSHTLVIACVSPSDSNMEETLTTLQYADLARKIENKPVVNRDDTQAAEIMRRRQEKTALEIAGIGTAVPGTGTVAGGIVGGMGATRTITETHPDPRIVVIGLTGTGKSTLCNILIGKDPYGNDPDGFPTSSEVDTHTFDTTVRCGQWLGTGPPVTVIDTPGLGDPGDKKDTETIKNMTKQLKTLGHVHAFLIVINGKSPRFDEHLVTLINNFTNMFGMELFDNTILEVSNWQFDARSKVFRSKVENSEDKYSSAIADKICKFFSTEKVIPMVFMDALHNVDENIEETEFKKQSSKLWKHINQFEKYMCKDIKDVMAERDKVIKEAKEAKAALEKQEQEMIKERARMEIQAQEAEAEAAQQLSAERERREKEAREAKEASEKAEQQLSAERATREKEAREAKDAIEKAEQQMNEERARMKKQAQEAEAEAAQQLKAERDKYEKSAREARIALDKAIEQVKAEGVKAEKVAKEAQESREEILQQLTAEKDRKENENQLLTKITEWRHLFYHCRDNAELRDKLSKQFPTQTGSRYIAVYDSCDGWHNHHREYEDNLMTGHQYLINGHNIVWGHVDTTSYPSDWGDKFRNAVRSSTGNHARDTLFQIRGKLIELKVRFHLLHVVRGNNYEAHYMKTGCEFERRDDMACMVVFKP